MKIGVCLVFGLLIVSVRTVLCHLPDITPTKHEQEHLSFQLQVCSQPISRPDKTVLARLPGLCRRLKRRRLTLLCRMEKFCRGRSQGTRPGQVCRCPGGSSPPPPVRPRRPAPTSPPPPTRPRQPAPTSPPPPHRPRRPAPADPLRTPPLR
ncbi:mulatexin [Salarias fasciatus]|uniref:mulatexin n=1 Tax=Salarias fasciatus TaxID=181472 RepID=UPI001176E063|nr:mulatexin-like [Salarias fasciatus]